MNRPAPRLAQLIGVLTALALWASRSPPARATQGASAGEPADGPRPISLAPLERWALADGTAVWLLRDQRTPLIQMSILLPIGTWSPWARRHHVYEAFTAQVGDEAGSLAREADRHSVAVTVPVGSRHSELRLQFLKQDLDGALGLLRAILRNRDYARGVLVRSRWAQGPAWAVLQREPNWLLAQASARALFAADDPRHRHYDEPEPISTRVAELAQTRDTLLRLPGRLITLVGDLSRDEASRLCTGLLPPIAPLSASSDPNEALAPRYQPPVGRLRDTSLTLAKLTQVYFHYSRPALAMTDADFAKLLIADQVLGGMGPHGRLYKALRTSEGDTYTPYTLAPLTVQPEIYSLVAYTRTANAVTIESKLRGVLQRLYQDGITEQEHADAVNHLVQSYVREYQEPHVRLRLAVWEWSLGLPAGSYALLLQQVKASSRDAVNAFIRTFYDPALFAMLKVGPKP